MFVKNQERPNHNTFSFELVEYINIYNSCYKCDRNLHVHVSYKSFVGGLPVLPNSSYLFIIVSGRWYWQTGLQSRIFRGPSWSYSSICNQQPSWKCWPTGLHERFAYPCDYRPLDSNKLYHCFSYTCIWNIVSFFNWHDPGFEPIIQPIHTCILQLCVPDSRAIRIKSSKYFLPIFLQVW